MLGRVVDLDPDRRHCQEAGICVQCGMSGGPSSGQQSHQRWTRMVIPTEGVPRAQGRLRRPRGRRRRDRVRFSRRNRPHVHQYDVRRHAGHVHARRDRIGHVGTRADQVAEASERSRSNGSTCRGTSGPGRHRPGPTACTEERCRRGCGPARVDSRPDGRPGPRSCRVTKVGPGQHLAASRDGDRGGFCYGQPYLRGLRSQHPWRCRLGHALAATVR